MYIQDLVLVIHAICWGICFCILHLPYFSHLNFSLLLCLRNDFLCSNQDENANVFTSAIRLSCETEHTIIYCALLHSVRRHKHQREKHANNLAYHHLPGDLCIHKMLAKKTKNILDQMTAEFTAQLQIIFSTNEVFGEL